MSKARTDVAAAARARATLSRASACVVEPLERRQLLAASATPIAYEPNGLIGTTAGAGGDHAPSNGINLETGVRYFDGALALSHNDLFSEGFGSSFGHTRSWTNFDSGYGVAGTWGGIFGNGWVVEELPYVRQTSGGSNALVEVVSSGTSGRPFDDDSTAGTVTHYEQPYFATPGGDASAQSVDRLKHDTATDVFTLMDPSGAVLEFYGFASGTPAARRGKLIERTDAGGKVTTVNYHASTHVLESVSRTEGSLVERFRFSYVSAGTNAGKVESVTHERSTNGGSSYSMVRRADYAYYEGGVGEQGNAGDLKTAKVWRDLDSDGTLDTSPDELIDTTYYRYYRSGDGGGFSGALKMVLEPESFEHADASIGGGALAASDANLDDYADLYLTYDGSSRVATAKVPGAGSSGATPAGIGTFSYSYTSHAEWTTPDHFSDWRYKTTETTPDGHAQLVYANLYGQPLLNVFDQASSSNEWRTFWEYDASGRLILQANESAISGYSDSNRDLLNYSGSNWQYIEDSIGLVRTWDYTTSGGTADASTTGTFGGYLDDWSLNLGETGSDVLQGKLQYRTRTSGDHRLTYVVEASDYPDGSTAATTTYAYTWQSGTARPESVTSALPKVTEVQNGPGTSAAADTEVAFFDAFGWPTWFKDAGGFLHYTAYDTATGGVTREIVDVLHTTTADFANLPSGWTTPSSGVQVAGGKHLKDDYVVDHLGRPTKHTYPNGTRVDYTVYLDATHTVRHYRAWQSTPKTPLLPVQSVRNDRAGGYSEQIDYLFNAGYTSPLPSEPTGADTYTDRVKAARSYRNAAGQRIGYNEYADAATTPGNMSSAGSPSDGISFRAWAYDARGRLIKEVDDSGTITRYVRDALGRVTAVWMGIDDTGATDADPDGSGSPNDLVVVDERVYDGGGLGDSNLTKVTRHVNATSGDDRVSLYEFDWRNRLVLTRNGVTFPSNALAQEYLYLTYDNRDNVLTAERFHSSTGNTSWTVTSGVPASPSSGDRTHKASYAYDEQGRLYRTSTFSVNTSSGAVSSDSLDTDTWYDRRGNVLKTVAPGGLVTKGFYDGAGRITATYLGDGGSDPAPGASSNWDHADDVTGDRVLEQRETTYDANSNPIFSTTRLRFHNETGTGALVDKSTSPKARVMYAASYYDDADRLVDVADVGTNGGSSYTRPGSVPSRSDTVLVTTYDFSDDLASGKDRDRLSDVTDSRGIVTRHEHDNRDQLTKLVEAYVDGTPSDGDDRTTTWTYDGLGNVLTMTADLPSGQTDQTTTYQYAARISPSTGGPASGFNSNSHLSGIAYTTINYPAPPISVNQQSTEYLGVNRLGEQTGWKDRNGSVHAYAYDLLGRLVLDDVTTVGSLGGGINVDGTVRKLAYEYDDAGLLKLLSSKNSSNTVLNQIERVYNGLGQLTGEEQEHDGAVDGSTIGVTYAYTEMASSANHSRLTSMTYPDGTALAYGYGTGGGLDDLTSRLSKLAFDGVDVETYEYLGLGTVVVRDRPQASHTLTYVKQGMEGDGEAGDQYAGLDRFGRILDQRWTLDAGGHADRFTYGHDRGFNRLWKKNELSASHSELYMADAADEQAAYDKLNRLTSFQRGTLSDAVGSDGYFDTVSTASREQSWSLDALGNWKDATTDGVTEYREHDGQNRLEKIDDDSDLSYDDFDGTPVKDLLYSAKGELRVDGDGKIFIYDAWGRLISVNTDGTGAAEVTYAYDALFRRTDNDGSHLYYTASWQAIEERSSATASTATHQYVWSPVYVDAMVLRDRDANASADGVLEERLYATHDANFNVTSLTNASGTVQERFMYDPYGTRAVLDANWAADADGVSDYVFDHGHHGGRHDLSAGLVGFGFREDNVGLGRWQTQDPLGFVDGPNRYLLLRSAPANWLDPDGLQVIESAGQPEWRPGMGPAPAVWDAPPAPLAAPAGVPAAGGSGLKRIFGRIINKAIAIASNTDIAIGIDADLVPIFGAEGGFGIVIDTGDLGGSGIYGTGGLAGGGSVGAGVVVTIIPGGEIEGESVGVDVNYPTPAATIGPAVIGGVSDTGHPVLGVGIGVGGGASSSVQNAGTITVRDIWQGLKLVPGVFRRSGPLVRLGW